MTRERGRREPAPFVRRYPDGVRFVAAIAALAVAIGAAQAAPPANVRGLVVAPQRLACPPGEPCDPAPVGVYVAFVRGTRQVARVKVARDGSFATRLLPGRYGIRLLPPPLGGRVYPATLLVPRGKAITLRIVVKRTLIP